MINEKLRRDIIPVVKQLQQVLIDNCESHCLHIDVKKDSISFSILDDFGEYIAEHTETNNKVYSKNGEWDI